MTYSVLALDLATTTGWALHKPGMERPFFGAFRLKAQPEEVGWPCEQLREFLADQYSMHKFTHFVFEAQHASQRIDMHVLNRLLALGGMVEWFAYRKNAKCYRIDIGTWRKHFTGRGTGHKAAGIDVKQQCIQICAEYGWHVDVHDAAEACGILDYFLTLLPNYERPWRDRRLMTGVRL